MKRDDLNMIPDWSIQQMMDDERSVESCIEKRAGFNQLEPEASEWIDLLIQTDIEKLESVFSDLFDDKMMKAVQFLLWKSVLRGWVMGESKWKSNLLTLPGECPDRNPRHYKPRSEDFS